MSKVKDILSVRNDIVFGGAVQVDWFYTSKSQEIAENFVFHGPKYHGISDDDFDFLDHELMDTCTYTKRIANSLYNNDEKNFKNIIMTIAGYGTGKSHLAITLGELFSNEKNSKISKRILKNLAMSDNNLTSEISSLINNKNLVIVLNGMEDFNLNYEILSNSKKILNNYGYKEEFFSDFTKAYDIAQSFLKRNFDKFEDKFKETATTMNINEENLYSYLVANPYKDEVFDLINEVYKYVTSNYIRWDSGISVKEILKKLSEKLCGPNDKFNKILILFDEFGRYIEYAAAYPNRAGDSAIQQIFEAVQDSDKIVFNGFIQSDLKTYLSRVDKSSNISRYIGRYESGEKLYLSSNLETIFANIIQKSDKDKFKHYILEYFKKEEIKEKYKTMQKEMLTSIYKLSQKSVWENWNKFYEVIVQGIYPFHPLTIYSLTSLSDWYQQRSALNFILEMFERNSEFEINELGDLPIIRATQIVRSDFFDELLLAEKEGRQKSENCILYDRILTKYSEKFSESSLELLAGLLIYKLIKIRTESKNELFQMISYITGMNKNLIKDNIIQLEDEYGVILYDENNNVYDFIEDAVGVNDFKLFLHKKRNQIKDDSVEVLITSKILEDLGILSNVETSFSAKMNIATREWEYKQDLISIESFNKTYIKNMIKDILNSTSPSEAKGRLIYLYNYSKFEISNIERVSNLYNEYSLDTLPIVLVFLDDSDDKLYKALMNIKLNTLITQEERIKFSRHIVKFESNIKTDLEFSYHGLLKKRQYITDQGVYQGERLSKVTSAKFINLYNKVISFPFDGFANKNITKYVKMLFSILRSISSKMFNYQWVETQDKVTRTRIEMILKNEFIGWGVLNSNWDIVYPKNKSVRLLFNEMDEVFDDIEYLSIKELYNKYTQPPYGLNDYSIILLVTIYIYVKGIEVRPEINGQSISFANWGINCFDGTSISFKEFLSTTIKKIDLEGYLEKYRELCSKIEKNDNLELFMEYNRKLENITSESEIPEELSDRVDMCRYIVKDGMSAYKTANNNVRSIKNKIEYGIEKNSYKDILIGLMECKNITTYITEKEKYKYTQEQLDIIKKIQAKGLEYVKNNYKDYIKSQSCDSYGQLTAWEKWMQNLERDLKELNFSNLAAETRERRYKVSDNINLIKDKQNVIEDSSDFINNIIINEFTSYQDLVIFEETANNLLNRFKKNEFLKVDFNAKKIHSQLSDLLKKIVFRKKEIRNMIMEVSNLSLDMKTIKEARDTLDKLKNVISLKLSKNDMEYMKEIGNVLENFFREYSNIEQKDLHDRKKLVSELRIKYKEFEEILNIIEVIDDYSISINNQINNNNKEWEKKYLLFDEKSIKEWDANRSAKWIENTKVLPEYLSEDLIKKYYKIKNVILERQSELKLESIMIIFDNLSEQEKKDCIKLLSSKL